MRRSAICFTYNSLCNWSAIRYLFSLLLISDNLRNKYLFCYTCCLITDFLCGFIQVALCYVYTLTLRYQERECWFLNLGGDSLCWLSHLSLSISYSFINKYNTQVRPYHINQLHPPIIIKEINHKAGRVVLAASSAVIWLPCRSPVFVDVFRNSNTSTYSYPSSHTPKPISLVSVSVSETLL